MSSSRRPSHIRIVEASRDGMLRLAHAADAPEGQQEGQCAQLALRISLTGK